MKTYNFITLCFILILLACKEPSNKSNHLLTAQIRIKTQEDSIENASNKTDTSNQYIYDFMKIVIKDQQLDLSNGIALEPEENCSTNETDVDFLSSLLIEKKKVQNDTFDLKNMIFTIYEFPKCLTKYDIDYMLLQKKEMANFKWNNYRLGFNQKNRHYWYSLSVPIFSKDKHTAVMKINNLCNGLCGSGYTVVFVYKNNHWTSTISFTWIS